MNQQNGTFAHVVRANEQDPMKQMTINSNLEIPGARFRKVGRPRNPWILANCEWLCEKEHPGEEYDNENDDHKKLDQSLLFSGLVRGGSPTLEIFESPVQLV